MSIPAPIDTGHTRPLVRRLAWLGLGLLLLYYLVTQTVATQSLGDDLAEAQAQTVAARERAQTERADLEERLDSLQSELENAREDVEALRQQLIDAGITPAIPDE